MNQILERFRSEAQSFVDANTITKWHEVEIEIADQQATGNPSFPVDEDLNTRVAIWKGNMTKLKIGAIVNAANKSLLGGGGIDGAIHSAAGRGLYEECRKLNGCDTGQTKLTGGHNLPAAHILHTVGPVYGYGGNQSHSRTMLESCYKTCLDVAAAHDIRSVCFCCISTGIYGYPNDDAADVALFTVRKWLDEGDNRRRMDLVVFCTFLPVDERIYHQKMPLIFPRNTKEEEKEEEKEEGHKESADVGASAEAESSVADAMSASVSHLSISAPGDVIQFPAREIGELVETQAAAIAFPTSPVPTPADIEASPKAASTPAPAPVPAPPTSPLPSDPPTQPARPVSLSGEEKGKRLKALRKKLKQIAELKAKGEAAGDAALNDDQRKKVKTEPAIIEEIANLEKP